MDLTHGVVLLSGLVIAYGVARVAWRKHDARWEPTARQLGLRLRRAGLWGSLALTGKYRGVPVTVRTRMPNEKQRCRTVRIEVECAEAPPGLMLKPEGGLANVKKALAGEDLLTGDRPFDEAVYVAGPADAALATLSSPARQAVRDLFAAYPTTSLAGGRLVVETLLSEDLPDFFVQQPLEAVVRAARLLRVSSVPEALAENARADPEPAARLRNLEALLRYHARSEEAAAALRAALVDPSPEVRLAGASSHPGAESDPVLAALAEDRSAPARVRALALERLAARRPYPEIAALARRALGSDDPLELRGALALVGAARDALALDAVLGLLSRGEAAHEVAVQAAGALGAIGDARAEPALLALLGQDRAEVRQAAARALGAAGTVRAVEPLLPIARGAVFAPGLREAALEALRRIQGRLVGASAGQVSLSTTEQQAAAGLSLVEEDGAPTAAAKGERERG